MPPLFIGCCIPHHTTVQQPRTIPKPKSIPTLVQINRNNLHTNGEEARLYKLGDEHAYIMPNIIEYLFEKSPKIRRVLEVRNTKGKDARFDKEVEAHERSLEKAGRCNMAALDQVWRFCGVPVSCSLGSLGASRRTLCDSEQCGLCNVLREKKGGILTTKSNMALEYVGDVGVGKAVILCKVVAGRVDLASSEGENGVTSRFDSRVNAKADVLYVRNSSAVLPKFVVFY